MATNNRASLLANLRTGGVRSSTNPVPQTAAPTVTTFQQQDHPMTAAVNGSFQANPMQTQAQLQVFQMQMMQMEIMRLQALQQAQQAQQYQIELTRQQQQNTNRRTSYGMEPATAGPTVTAFPRPRASQVDLLQSKLHLNPVSEDQVPQTAALGGKFGGRLNPNATSFRFGASAEELDVAKATPHGTTAPANTPSTPNYTTVISGGTPLGLSNGASPSTSVSTSNMTPSKSDTALNWRRGSNQSVLNGNRTASVNVRITPPPEEKERVSPPPAPTASTAKTRPVPLRFSVAVSAPLPSVAIDTSEGDATDETDETASSSSSNKSDSSPTTPRTSSSSGSTSMTSREEASKRLYEGLGIGRPVPQTAQIVSQGFGHSVGNGNGIIVPHTSTGLAFNTRIFSQPMRQPRGPPSGAEELGPKNFATRIRRKAIGGLGAMLDARINRAEVEAY